MIFAKVIRLVALDREGCEQGCGGLFASLIRNRSISHYLRQAKAKKCRGDLMEWDYFISHASEDKVAIAQPLASYLSKAGFRVWYDEFSLKLGDSLLQSIDAGLAQSDFGIVVLSRNFFAKKWPKRELSGLFSLENEKKKVLPIWHDITAQELSILSPILADRMAISSDKGLQVVAESIVAASFPDRKAQLVFRTDPERYSERVYEKAQSEFRKLLERAPTAADIKAFLSINHRLIIGPHGWDDSLLPGFVLPSSIDVDFVVFSPQAISGPIILDLVFLGSLDRQEIGVTLERIAGQLGPRVATMAKPYNYHGGTLLGEFPKLAPLGVAMQGLMDSANLHFDDPNVWVIKVSVYGGRRASNGEPAEVQLPSGMRDMQVDVGSYDRIADEKRTFRRF